MLFNPAALTEFRKVRGLSRSELADAARKSRPYITQLEQGDRSAPSPAALADICEALGIDPRALFVEPSLKSLLREVQEAHGREDAA